MRMVEMVALAVSAALAAYLKWGARKQPPVQTPGPVMSNHLRRAVDPDADVAAARALVEQSVRHQNTTATLGVAAGFPHVQGYAGSAVLQALHAFVLAHAATFGSIEEVDGIIRQMPPLAGTEGVGALVQCLERMTSHALTAPLPSDAWAVVGRMQDVPGLDTETTLQQAFQARLGRIVEKFGGQDDAAAPLAWADRIERCRLWLSPLHRAIIHHGNLQVFGLLQGLVAQQCEEVQDLCGRYLCSLTFGPCSDDVMQHLQECRGLRIWWASLLRRRIKDASAEAAGDILRQLRGLPEFDQSTDLQTEYARSVPDAIARGSSEAVEAVSALRDLPCYSQVGAIRIAYLHARRALCTSQSQLERLLEEVQATPGYPGDQGFRYVHLIVVHGLVKSAADVAVARRWGAFAAAMETRDDKTLNILRSVCLNEVAMVIANAPDSTVADLMQMGAWVTDCVVGRGMLAENVVKTGLEACYRRVLKSEADNAEAKNGLARAGQRQGFD